MNDYIVLDGLKYRATHKKFEPTLKKPATLRKTLLGKVDVTYGQGVFREMNLILQVPAAPEAGWGSIQDLRQTAAQTGLVPLTLHDGTQANAAILGDYSEESLSSVWDITENYFRVSMRFVL